MESFWNNFAHKESETNFTKKGPCQRCFLNGFFELFQNNILKETPLSDDHF